MGRLVFRAGCALIYKDLVLLVHQKESGFWGFPKGRLNAKERENTNLVMCAARELKEETGVVIEQEILKKSVCDRRTFIYTVILNEIPEITIDYKEIDDYKWVNFWDINVTMSNSGKILYKKIKNKIKN